MWSNHTVRGEPVRALELDDGSLGTRPEDAVYRSGPLIGRPQMPLNSPNLVGTAQQAIACASAHGLGPLSLQHSVRLRSRDAVDRKSGRALESLHGSLGQRAVKPVDRSRLLTERVELTLKRPNTRGSFGSPIARSERERRHGGLAYFRCLGDLCAGLGRTQQAQEERCEQARDASSSDKHPISGLHLALQSSGVPGAGGRPERTG